MIKRGSHCNSLVKTKTNKKKTPSYRKKKSYIPFLNSYICIRRLLHVVSLFLLLYIFPLFSGLSAHVTLDTSFYDFCIVFQLNSPKFEYTFGYFL